MALDVGDLVWVFLCCERIPVGTYNKLMPKKTGPCRILNRINNNAYKVQLPTHVKTATVFNIEDLTPYKGEETLVDVLDDGEDANSRASSSQEEGTDEEPILLPAEGFMRAFDGAQGVLTHV